MGCSGNCSSCGGCARELVLTRQELTVLEKLGQLAFLPVARRVEDMRPVYLEDHDETPEQYSLILQCLEKKGLIDISYDRPLKGVDMAAYGGYPVHGSIGLSARGQQVLEMLEIQGALEG